MEDKYKKKVAENLEYYKEKFLRDQKIMDDNIFYRSRMSDINKKIMRAIYISIYFTIHTLLAGFFGIMTSLFSGASNPLDHMALGMSFLLALALQIGVTLLLFLKNIKVNICITLFYSVVTFIFLFVLIPAYLTDKIYSTTFIFSNSLILVTLVCAVVHYYFSVKTLKEMEVLSELEGYPDFHDVFMTGESEYHADHFVKPEDRNDGVMVELDTGGNDEINIFPKEKSVVIMEAINEEQPPGEKNTVKADIKKNEVKTQADEKSSGFKNTRGSKKQIKMDHKDKEIKNSFFAEKSDGIALRSLDDWNSMQEKIFKKND